MSLSVDKALRQAQSHLKAGELAEAESLYKQVLSKFPKNKKAIQGHQKLKLGITSKGSVNSEPPQETTDELITLYNQGHFEAVLLKIKILIGLYPKAIVLFNLQGASNSALHRYDLAITSYKQAIDVNPNYADAHYNMGNVLGRKNELDAAIECYKQALKINPEYAEAYYNMGLLLQDRWNIGAAIECYKQALKINPEYAEAHYNMGHLLQDRGNIGAAIECYKQALKINPEYAEAHYNMGVALKEKGETVAAIESYEKALQIKPNFAEAYTNMGFALQATGNIEAAIDSFNNVLKINPDYVETYTNIGLLLFNKGDLDAAIKSYKEALKIKPDYAEAYSNIGNVLKDKGELDAAIESYKRAIVIKSDYAEAHYNMGVALKEKGETVAAIESYEHAIMIKPDYAQAYYNMSNALKSKGDLDAAIESYKQAITIKPNYAEAYYNMGLSLQDKGDLDAAIESYKLAIQIKPDYAEAYINMGLVLQNKGDLDESIESYKEAIKIKPNYADAHSNMGVALKEKGETDAAIESYEYAIMIKPDYAQAHLNLSFALLNSGRLKEGLDAREWRWKTAKLVSSQRHFLQPLWDGKTSLLDKKILVWREQGVGDTLVWSSRLSLLASQAGHCILECEEKLIPLLSRSFPNVEVKPEDRNRDTERDDFDFHLPIGSLYRHFITEITQNPRPDAFLIPDPVRIKFWKDRLSSLGSGPWVGISWKSSSMGGQRWKNFSSISEWSSLLKLPNIAFINLQYADAVDGLLQIQNEFGVKVHNFDDLDQYNDLDDVAALSAALDCVVSFGTSVDMITAGVGTSTKCVLRASSDDNNILGRPVGPLVDIFERNTWEPWSNVLGLIAEDIAKL